MQLDLFDLEELIPEEPAAPESNLFNPEKAHWYPAEHVPHQQVCQVKGIIPAYVKSPTEDGIRRDYPTKEYGDMLDIWTAYVWGISLTIPYQERAANDANGWLAANEMLKAARDQEQPILFHIWDHRQQDYSDLEVVEYLPAPEKGKKQ